jgi:hypothetical protein
MFLNIRLPWFLNIIENIYKEGVGYNSLPTVDAAVF